MHDFYGFPEEMYKITYPAPGDSELATQIRQRFEANNLHAKAVTGRGLDHGVWVILRKMYPDANIPVVALSVDSKRSPHEQYSIGTMLSDLREEGILIIGSGGLVHNLRMVHESDEPDEWAVAFDEWIAERLTEWNLNNLFAFDKKRLMPAMLSLLMDGSILSLCSTQWVPPTTAVRQSDCFNLTNMAV